jgi:Anti-sigma factor NepR
MKHLIDRKRPNSKSSSAAVVEDAIGAKLKAYYAEMSKKEIPQQFLDLLDQLDKASDKK